MESLACGERGTRNGGTNESNWRVFSQTQTHTHREGSYPHWQVGPKVDYEDSNGLPPVIDGVDKVQTLLFLCIQHSEHS